MVTDARWGMAIPMTIDPQTDLLSLVQWMSPAFPLGSFAYSHGLETAITDGHIHDAESLQDWLQMLLAFGNGHNDALLVSLAHQGQDPVALHEIARALAASPERLEETMAQGRAFVTTTNAILGTDLSELCLPVAVGVQSRRLTALSRETLLSLYLQSFLGNLVQCAIRFVPLGQTDGHRVLSRLGDEISAKAKALAEASQADFASATYAADMGSMRHTYQDVRVFRT